MEFRKPKKFEPAFSLQKTLKTPLDLTPVTGQIVYPCGASQFDCIDESKKPVPLSDFGPPTWTFDNANFAGVGGITNINIEIKDARHNDFSYDSLAWNANLSDSDIKKKEINRRTNLFMRGLYRAVVEDQATPGTLDVFLEELRGKGTAIYENGIWKIDPLKVQD